MMSVTGRGRDISSAYTWNPLPYLDAHTREIDRGGGRRGLSLWARCLETARIVIYSHVQLRKTSFWQYIFLQSNGAQSLIQSQSTGDEERRKNTHFGHKTHPVLFANPSKKVKK
jgi:hypothetical protein